MMQRHEAEGNFQHPAYQAAITLLNHRHVLRLDEWPKSVTASLNDWNADVYGAMQGPNEFLYTGNLKDWNRIADMPRITTPTLIMCGAHDEFTPACAMRMHQALPRSEVTVFPNSSHMPMWEEPLAYLDRLTRFLDGHRAAARLILVSACGSVIASPCYSHTLPALLYAARDFRIWSRGFRLLHITRENRNRLRQRSSRQDLRNELRKRSPIAGHRQNIQEFRGSTRHIRLNQECRSPATLRH